MNSHIKNTFLPAVLCAILAVLTGSADGQTNDWEDPAVVGINKEPAHFLQTCLGRLWGHCGDRRICHD